MKKIEGFRDDWSVMFTEGHYNPRGVGNCAFPTCENGGTDVHHILYQPECTTNLCRVHHIQITILNQKAAATPIPKSEDSDEEGLSNEERVDIWGRFVDGEYKNSVWTVSKKQRNYLRGMGAGFRKVSPNNYLVKFPKVTKTEKPDSEFLERLFE